MTPTPIEAWADRLEGAIARTPACCVDRVRVVAETASTQDAAVRLAGGTPGLLVVAGRQTGGRGQHGRTWADTADLGVAATFAIADAGRDSADLAAAGGVAAYDAVRSLAPGAPLRLKRPNDLLALGADGVARKLAGVLIERRSGFVLVGIGVNVAQRDWPGELAASAISLAQLGVDADRVAVVEALIGALSNAIALDRAQLDERWDALRADA
ncbi:MAG: hypothetical protein R3B49_08530 [Phycisphaerales bacterium]